MLEKLRQKHPRFYYKQYSIEKSNGAVTFKFEFLIEPDLVFAPTLTIQNVDLANLSSEVLNNLAFHMGLIEIPSYWKATCSPEIIIESGVLNADQLAWWKTLLMNGMGEFFFVNQIDFTLPDFVTLSSTGRELHPRAKDEHLRPDERTLVPIGGGKDSVLTLEILRQNDLDIGCLLLNPTQAAQDIVERSGGSSVVQVKRTIDPHLLRLNTEGYLNGHTPFSALLAFLGVTCGVLFGYKYIALSNERSSNEGNRFFHGVKVNHQYSKTFDFEQKFRAYLQDYLVADMQYFSFLRPVYELQIAREFAKLTQYHGVFRSCNRGQKTNIWCHECPKCLFAYTVLYPFIDPLQQIFSHDLFDKEELLPIALELVGAAEQKPFECVGTHEETLVAFYMSAQKIREQGQRLPAMLQALDDLVLSNQPNLGARAEVVLNAWNVDHVLPTHFEDYLKAALHERV